MELRQLKYFVTLARTLNFSEAAQKLFITQGTLSQQISQLEDEMGERLFLRTSHSVALTEAGQELLPLALRTIDDSNACRKKMTDLKSMMCGSLNIGLTHSFSGLFTDTMRAFVRQYPGVKLNVVYSYATDLVERLHDKELDFILAFRPVKQYDKMESEVLFSSNLSAVMRKTHPLADRQSLTFDEVRRQRVVLPGSGLQARREFDRFIDVDTSRMNVVAELNEPNIILDLLQSTDMVSILSSLAIHYRPNLVALPVIGLQKSMDGCIHRLKDGYRKRSEEAFLALLRDSAQIMSIVSRQ